MNSDRGRKRNLASSDSGRDAAGDELDSMLADGEKGAEAVPCEDSGFDSFLERFPASARQRRARG